VPIYHFNLEIWNTIPYFIAFISIIIAKVLISVLMVLPLFFFPIDSSDGSFRIRDWDANFFFVTKYRDFNHLIGFGVQLQCICRLSDGALIAEK
jgi:hypothetical protein